MKGIELLAGPIVCFVVSFIGGIFSAIKAISIVTPIASLVVYFFCRFKKDAEAISKSILAGLSSVVACLVYGFGYFLYIFIPGLKLIFRQDPEPNYAIYWTGVALAIVSGFVLFFIGKFLLKMAKVIGKIIEKKE